MTIDEFDVNDLSDRLALRAESADESSSVAIGSHGDGHDDFTNGGHDDAHQDVSSGPIPVGGGTLA